MSTTATISDRSASLRDPRLSSGSTRPRERNASARERGVQADRGPVDPAFRKTSARRGPDGKPRTARRRESSALIPCQIGGETWRLAQRPYEARSDSLVYSLRRLSLVGTGLVVAALLILLFGVDLLTGWPFHQFSMSMDVAYLICGTLLLYLSWDAYHERA